MMRLGCNSLVRDPTDATQWIDIEALIDFSHELDLDLIDVQLDRGLKSLDEHYQALSMAVSHLRSLIL